MFKFRFKTLIIEYYSSVKSVTLVTPPPIIGSVVVSVFNKTKGGGKKIKRKKKDYQKRNRASEAETIQFYNFPVILFFL